MSAVMSTSCISSSRAGSISGFFPKSLASRAMKPPRVVASPFLSALTSSADGLPAAFAGASGGFAASAVRAGGAAGSSSPSSRSSAGAAFSAAAGSAFGAASFFAASLAGAGSSFFFFGACSAASRSLLGHGLGPRRLARGLLARLLGLALGRQGLAALAAQEEPRGEPDDHHRRDDSYDRARILHAPSRVWWTARFDGGPL
ncbi:MAG: hypothetical protein M5U28_06710 [Sandaracinaceae bacterium]|nr:hypothetical protein [Sandaracinaceae bacterium]